MNTTLHFVKLALVGYGQITDASRARSAIQRSFYIMQIYDATFIDDDKEVIVGFASAERANALARLVDGVFLYIDSAEWPYELSARVIASRK